MPEKTFHSAVTDYVIKKIDRLLLPQYLPSGQTYEQELAKLSFLFGERWYYKADYLLYLIELLKEDGLPITTRGRIINEIRENLDQVSIFTQAIFITLGPSWQDLSGPQEPPLLTL